MSNNSRKIEKYLSGELNLVEAELFELELKLNEQLANEYNLSAEIDQMIIQDEDILSFREQLLEVHERKASSLAGNFLFGVFHSRIQLAAASVVLLIFLTGLLYLIIPKSVSNEQLFSMYYHPDKVLSVTRSVDNQLFEAFIKYQGREFAEASRLFEAILREDENNFMIKLHNGIAYIETQRYQDAIATFNRILKDGDNLFTEHARWFLGLTYLRINETDKAINTFESIINDPGNYYHEEAKDLHARLSTRE
jgi:tetratricopeptide (TPR) repeat protein